MVKVPVDVPGWVIVTGTFATEMVALRGEPELMATTRVTVAEPVPEAAPETVTQLGKFDTAQEQELVVWILTQSRPN